MRFLRDDDTIQSPKARSLFAKASEGECILLATPMVLAECVWVLRSYYRVERESIAEKLSGLIRSKGVSCEPADAIGDALEHYAETKLDIVDCLLAARAVTGNESIATFDEAIRKLEGVMSWNYDSTEA
jgi:predicted nucleic-acid-binding protein